jgi:hypothetical protein
MSRTTTAKDDELPEDIPRTLRAGLDPAKQSGMMVGLMPNAKAPGGRRILHFSGFTEMLLALRLILWWDVLHVSRGDLNRSVAERYDIRTVLEEPYIEYRGADGLWERMWPDFMCEMRDGSLLVADAASLLPGPRGVENARRAAEAMRDWAERHGYRWALGTRSCLSQRAHINALYPYLGMMGYRGPLSLMDEVITAGTGIRCRAWDLVDRFEGVAGRDVAHAAVLAAMGTVLMRNHLDFPIEKGVLSFESVISFLPEDAPRRPWRPPLFEALPEELGRLLGVESLPDWVEATGKVVPENLDDEADRERLQACLAAYAEVDEKTLTAAAAFRRYDLGRFDFKVARFRQMVREYPKENDDKVFRRYATRESPESNVDERLWPDVAEWGRTHSAPRGLQLMRDPEFRRRCTADLKIDVPSAWSLDRLLELLARKDALIKANVDGRRPRSRTVSGHSKSWLRGQAGALVELDEETANYVVQVGPGERYVSRPHRVNAVDVVEHSLTTLSAPTSADTMDYRELIIRHATTNGAGMMYAGDHGGAVWNTGTFDVVVEVSCVFIAVAARQPWRKGSVEQVQGEYQDLCDKQIPTWCGAKPDDNAFARARREALQRQFTLPKALEVERGIREVWMESDHEDAGGVPNDIRARSEAKWGHRLWPQTATDADRLREVDMGHAEVTHNGVSYLGHFYTDPDPLDAADLDDPDIAGLPPESTLGRPIAAGLTGTVRRRVNTDDLRFISVYQDGAFRGRLQSDFFMRWQDGEPVSLWEYREWQRLVKEDRKRLRAAKDSGIARAASAVPERDPRRAAISRAKLRHRQERGGVPAPGPRPSVDAEASARPRKPRRKPYRPTILEPIDPKEGES